MGAQASAFLRLPCSHLLLLEVAPARNLEFEVLLLALVDEYLMVVRATDAVRNFCLTIIVILVFKELSTALAGKDRGGSPIRGYLGLVGCLCVGASVLKGVHARHYYTKLNH